MRKGITGSVKPSRATYEVGIGGDGPAQEYIQEILEDEIIGRSLKENKEIEFSLSISDQVCFFS